MSYDTAVKIFNGPVKTAGISCGILSDIFLTVFSGFDQKQTLKIQVLGCPWKRYDITYIR